MSRNNKSTETIFSFAGRAARHRGASSHFPWYRSDTVLPFRRGMVLYWEVLVPLRWAAPSVSSETNYGAWYRYQSTIEYPRALQLLLTVFPGNCNWYGVRTFPMVPLLLSRIQEETPPGSVWRPSSGRNPGIQRRGLLTPPREHEKLQIVRLLDDQTGNPSPGDKFQPYQTSGRSRFQNFCGLLVPRTCLHAAVHVEQTVVRVMERGGGGEWRVRQVLSLRRFHKHLPWQLWFTHTIWRLDNKRRAFLWTVQMRCIMLRYR